MKQSSMATAVLRQSTPAVLCSGRVGAMDSRPGFLVSPELARIFRQTPARSRSVLRLRHTELPQP